MTNIQTPAADTALRLTDLRVDFAVESGLITAVKGVSLDLRAGEVVAIVGESGSGKSVSSSAAMGLLPENALVAGSASIGAVEVVGIAPEKMRKMRATEVAMIFQEPMSALNPVLTVEKQMMEVFELHDVAYGDDARARSIDLLRRVGIPDPEARMRTYPHQVSGGQLQRIVIAMALVARPRVLLCDEPSTALDVATHGAGHRALDVAIHIALHAAHPQRPGGRRCERGRRDEDDREHDRRQRGAHVPHASDAHPLHDRGRERDHEERQARHSQPRRDSRERALGLAHADASPRDARVRP